jgi:hypothetical protein
MNVAGTRALLEPPAGLLTLVPGEPLPAPLSVLDVGCALTPPDAEVVDVFVGAGVLVELGVLVGLGVLAAPVLVVVPVVLAALGVLGVLGALAAEDAAEEVVDCLEPPHAASSAAAAKAPMLCGKCFTFSSIRGAFL